MAKTLTLAEDGIYLMVIPENGIYHLQLKPKRMLGVVVMDIKEAEGN